MHERKWPLLIGRICLAIVSAGLLVFGAIVAAVPMGADVGLYRANGLASFGLGLFGGLIVLVPYRRGEPWAWYALWFYPLFWAAHLIGQLPPGTDHIHQVVFIALSLTGLLLPARAFFPPAESSDLGDEDAAAQSNISASLPPPQGPVQGLPPHKI
ncbi:hypothetical protein [Microbacterium sp. Bi128]|uniref:hypothetical protein n=1 Tax=Microbacterium sp. Bi128 TaxID=2821115 RepID=UPI001DBB7F4C|nr:hypothetical protein [Microbacterium sp. Bi128]CAH0327134.1 hypothetical protein SRABI128_05798 [Microbacterium sp. Bi128]